MFRAASKKRKADSSGGVYLKLDEGLRRDSRDESCKIQKALLDSQFAVDFPLHGKIENSGRFDRCLQIQKLHVRFEVLLDFLIRRDAIARKRGPTGAVGVERDGLAHVEMLGEDLRRIVLTGKKEAVRLRHRAEGFF